MPDSLKIWGTDYTGVNGIKAKDANGNVHTYSTGTDASSSDSLKIWGTDYTGVNGFKAKDANGNIYTYGTGVGASE